MRPPLDSLMRFGKHTQGVGFMFGLTCVSQALVHQQRQIRPSLAKRVVKQVFYEFWNHRKSWGVVERRDRQTGSEAARIGLSNYPET